MDRAMFAHSRMLIEYEDGSSVGVCSLHCATLELALNIGVMPKSVQVGDHNTKALVDAEKASWVIGGSKPGVMTDRAKWAFRDPADAKRFKAEFGGTVAVFDQAVKAAFEDMYKSWKVSWDKRKKMLEEMR
jgi:nitrous oxide reductase accessory protein NosL